MSDPAPHKGHSRKKKSKRADPVMFLMLRVWTDEGYSAWIDHGSLSEVFWRKKIGAGDSLFPVS